MFRKPKIKVDLHDSTWHFTPKARLAVWKLGAGDTDQMEKFAGRLLARHALRDGETEINLQGEGLRITKQNTAYHVEHLEETG